MTVNVDWTRVPIPGSYSELYNYYGDPSDSNFQHDYIVTAHHEAGGAQVPMQVHVAIAERLHQVYVDLNSTGLVKLIKEFDGAYVVRNKRLPGSTTKSLHSWGLAIDLNASQYPQGSLKRWPDAFAAIWIKHGFVMGQDFHGIPDAMHIQFTRPHTI